MSYYIHGLGGLLVNCRLMCGSSIYQRRQSGLAEEGPMPQKAERELWLCNTWGRGETLGAGFLEFGSAAASRP